MTVRRLIVRSFFLPLVISLAVVFAVTAQPTPPTTRPAAVDWTPGTPIVAGGTYRLPAGVGVKIDVTAADVTFEGGPVWGSPGTAIYFRHAAANGRARVKFDYPNPPAARVKIPGTGTCIVTEADGTDVTGCDFGSVNECVRAMPGSSNLRVTGNLDTKRDIRGAWVYMAGVRGALITGNRFYDSATENGIRTSPQGDAISSGVVVRDNILKNPGNKNAIDARHVAGIIIEHNDIRNVSGGPAVRLGDSDLPGASAIVFRDNDVTEGQVYAKTRAAGVVTGNRFHGLDPAVTVPENIDPRSQIVPSYTTAFYVGPLPAKVKPVSTVPGVSNVWVNAATTQPVQ